MSVVRVAGHCSSLIAIAAEQTGSCGFYRERVMNTFIFADSQSCIGCRTCEVACVVSHQAANTVNAIDSASFTPRLQLVRNAEVTVPVMCRQCEDAPCAQVCPNKAIYREDNQIKVQQEKCIGCKTCAIACPYGAMQIVTKSTAKGMGLLTVKETRAEAIKCDLCSDNPKGPACVRVCPTGALRIETAADVEQANARKRDAAALAVADVI